MVASAKREPMAQEDISAGVRRVRHDLRRAFGRARSPRSLFPGKGAALSAAWRRKQLEYTWLRSLMGRYEDFSRVTLAALEWTLESLGPRRPTRRERSALLDEYRRLAMFPEVPAALEALAAKKPARDPVQRPSRHAQRRGRPQRPARRASAAACSSVHAAKIFKPAAAVYRIAEEQPRRAARDDRLRVVERLGCRGREVLRLPGRSGSTAAGVPVERLGVRPDAILRDLAELVRLAS